MILCMACLVGGMAAGFLLSMAFKLEWQDDLMEALAQLLENPLDDQVREVARRVLRNE